MSTDDANMDRLTRVRAFLHRSGYGSDGLQPIAGDASRRRYYRLPIASGSAVLVMDMGGEDAEPFRTIAELLHLIGLSAPRIKQYDRAGGLVILEDLGDDLFAVLARRDASQEVMLYRLALSVLDHLRRSFHPDMPGSPPPYSEAELRGEADLFCQWYLPAIGRPVGDEMSRRWHEMWTDLLPRAGRVPSTLVLRDYHAENLLHLGGRDGVAACGLLDFQDARVGPVTYDAVSLLEDARRDLSGSIGVQMRNEFFARFDADRQSVETSYAILGAQRNLKIIGIFTRLAQRDGKPRYLAMIERVWRHLRGDLAHPALHGLSAWLDQAIPADQRIAPPAYARDSRT